MERATKLHVSLRNSTTRITVLHTDITRVSELHASVQFIIAILQNPLRVSRRTSFVFLFCDKLQLSMNPMKSVGT